MNTGKYKIGMVKAMAQYITIFCFPGMMEWLPSYFQMFNSRAIEFFVKIIRSQIEARKKQDSATERRNDMIDLVVQALEEGGSKSFKDQKAFETAAIAQIFILFFAGFDTASTASALTRYKQSQIPNMSSWIAVKIGNQTVKELGFGIFYLMRMA